MPTDPNLSDLFRGDDTPPTTPLDPQQIIRRSRRRRLPSRIALGSVLSLAVIGVGVASVNALAVFSPGITAMSGSAESFDSADSSATDSSAPASEESFGSSSGDSGIMRAPAEKINLCGGAVAEVAPSASGLELTVQFPDAEVGSTSVTGTATLTNTGDTVVSGYSAPTPAITLAQDGVVIWHSNGLTILSAAVISLAPGESMTYTASFTPVVCAVEDDLGTSFRDTLPAASPGEYQVSAALDVTTDASTELVTGPPATITLR